MKKRNHKNPNYYWTLEKTIQDFMVFLEENRTELNTKSVYGLLEAKEQHGLRTAIGNWGGLYKLNKRFNLGLTLKGDKWSKTKVLDELKKLNNDGIPLTQSCLTKIGRSDLLGAINKYGTLNSLKEEIGLTITRQNYWTDEKVVDELRPIVAELGNMPSRTMLIAMGKGDVASAIAKRGGYTHFCALLNTQISKYYRAEDGHFLHSSYECIFDNILFKYGIPHDTHVLIEKNHRYRCDFVIGDTYIEIVGFIKKGNHEYHMNLQKKISLYEGLEKQYRIIPKEVFTKNIDHIEEEILPILQPLLPVKHCLLIERKVDIRPVVYWADIENVKKELLPLIEKYGRMPLDKEFRKERRSDLLRGIYTYHGNLYKIGRLLSISVSNKPKGYYSYEKVISIYTTLCKDQGRYLGQNELSQMNLHGMVNAIRKNGGLYALKQACNMNYPDQQKRSIRSMEEAITLYKKACVEKGGFLLERELKTLDGVLANYIQRNGGYYNVRKQSRLSFEMKRLPKQYYSKDEAITVYKQLCLERGYFLTIKEASTVMAAKLIGYIRETIGFNNLRALTGLDMHVKKDIKRITQEDKDKAVNIYTNHCINAGHPLSMVELKKMGEIKLAGFLIREIPIRKLKKTVAANNSLKPAGFLHKQIRRQEILNTAISQYKTLSLQYGHYISLKRLNQLGYRYLSGVISRNGGYHAFCILCNLGFQQEFRKYKEADVVEEYKNICIQLNKFVVRSELLKLGKISLANAISTHGGYDKIRNLTGLQSAGLITKSNALKLNNVLSVFKKLSMEKGSFFSKNDFIAIGAKKLAWFIQNNGGYRQFQKLSGLDVGVMHKPNQKDSLHKKGDNRYLVSL